VPALQYGQRAKKNRVTPSRQSSRPVARGALNNRTILNIPTNRSANALEATLEMCGDLCAAGSDHDTRYVESRGNLIFLEKR